MSELLRDSKLEDLFHQHEIAFQRKQLAWARQNKAWLVRETLKNKIGSIITRNKLQEKRLGVKITMSNDEDNLQSEKLRIVTNEHELLVNEYREAKEKFFEINKQLNEAKAEEKIKIDKNWNIALRAGVPDKYLDNISVDIQKDGTACIYFGGLTESDGPGYGYYIMNINDEVTILQECSNMNGKKSNGFRKLNNGPDGHNLLYSSAD